MILKDDILVKISLNPPRNINDLKIIKGFPYSKLSNKIKNLIILAVNKGKNSDINKGISKKTHIKSRAQKSLIDMLNILLKNTAETHNISSKLIDITNDGEIIRHARTRAFEIIENDPKLISNQNLKLKLLKDYKHMLEFINIG